MLIYLYNKLIDDERKRCVAAAHTPHSILKLDVITQIPSLLGGHNLHINREKQMGDQNGWNMLKTEEDDDEEF